MIAAVILSLTMSGIAYAKAEKVKEQVFEVKVTKKGYEPSSIDAKAGQPVTLVITRTTDSTCARKITVPEKNISKDLPLEEPIRISLGKLEKGEIRFGCGMNMMVGGVITAK